MRFCFEACKGNSPLRPRPVCRARNGRWSQTNRQQRVEMLVEQVPFESESVQAAGGFVLLGGFEGEAVFLGKLGRGVGHS